MNETLKEITHPANQTILKIKCVHNDLHQCQHSNLDVLQSKFTRQF
jgi:hypothetical protein